MIKFRGRGCYENHLICGDIYFHRQEDHFKGYVYNAKTHQKLVKNVASLEEPLGNDSISGSDDIQNIKGDKFEISKDGKFLTLSGLEKDTKAYLYSVNGMLMERIRVTSSTSISINLESYPLGVYMIKVDGATYKIMNQ